ncbi:Hypothetical protein PHPALM_7109 [Phytophthora palmivora]|uniref:Uncharacterized protein n=1 Tax=Phytophthora palmivora TaxID=4796 RepID=A0A2P4YD55_9STRA|nr:Hypothetical protein PHPALM_7109 [Phytophthora palmivora]
MAQHRTWWLRLLRKIFSSRHGSLSRRISLSTRRNRFRLFEPELTQHSNRSKCNHKEKGSKAPLIPDEWEQYARTYVCTHAETTNLKLPASVSARKLAHGNAQRSYWEIAAVISKCTLEHNQRLNERDFRHDPSKRLMLDSNNLRTVEVLWKAGTKKFGIFKYIKENSASNPTIQDVHNLVRALK